MKSSQFDERRMIVVPGNDSETIEFAVEHWITQAAESIADHGFFAVALSGGSTPKKIYQLLSQPHKSSRVEWKKVLLFWSDERAVPPDHPESNYRMAMEEAGFNQLPIPKENIFRMKAEKEIEAHAKAYEETIKTKLGGRPFDLIMLGMGEDGHTASLFPHTDALHMVNCLVAPNHVPQKNTWRMTFTFECINRSPHVVLYALGASKAAIVARVLTSPYHPDELPSQRIGTSEHKALYLLDNEASQNLFASLK